MTDGWGSGIGSAQADVVFDLAAASPQVFSAVSQAAPRLSATLDRLRTAIPVMASAAPGMQAPMYRLKFHYRSVCLALGEDTTATRLDKPGSESVGWRSAQPSR